MHSYTVHGLSLSSELSFPQLPRGTGSDILIHYGDIGARDSLRKEEIMPGTIRHITSDGVVIASDGVGRLLIRNGNEIIVDRAQNASETKLRETLLGALQIVLVQRGRLVLHASAVEMNGYAVVFLGEPGQGKSTTAAALYCAGHRLLADDIISVEFRDKTPVVFPEYPTLSLFQDSYSIISRQITCEPVEQTFGKLSLAINDRLPVGPLLLHCAYVLAEGATFRIEPLSSHEALSALISGSYVIEQSESIASAYLVQCAQLVRAVNVRRLTVRRVPTDLTAVARIVEADNV